jgi:hypothetical protein
MASDRDFRLSPYKTKTRNRREFLCDFAWLRWHKSHPLWLIEVPLLAESEWLTKNKSIVYDFRKLIPLKARLKLCVYQVKGKDSEATAEKCRNEITQALKPYDGHT